MRLPVVLAAVPLAVLVACSAPVENQTTPTDVDRAFAAVADPWAAPDSVSFPTGEYGGSNLLRRVGERTRTFHGTRGHDAMLAEVGSAQSVGWRLAGLECADRRTSEAVLTKGTTPDDAMLAEVRASGGEVTVTVSVAHHLDGSWPTYGEVPLADTCASGGRSEAVLPEDLPFDAIPGGTAQPSLEDYEPWQRDSLSEEEQALLDEVGDDPVLDAAGVAFAEPDLREGDNWRAAITGGADVSVGAGTTGASVAEVLARTDWELTWASCGARLPTVATARLPIESGTVTARLTSLEPGTVTVSLGLPVPEAPLTWPAIEEAPTLAWSPCLGPDGVTEPQVVDGTHVEVPSELHPYLAGTS